MDLAPAVKKGGKSRKKEREADERRVTLFFSFLYRAAQKRESLSIYKFLLPRRGKGGESTQGGAMSSLTREEREKGLAVLLLQRI